MNFDQIDAYLAGLSLELRKRGVSDTRFVEEARDHLTDAVEHGLEHGLDVSVAQQEAIAQFGRADAVACDFVGDKYRLFDRIVLLAGIIFGLTITNIDARSNWDDTGVTAFCLVVAAAMCGFIAPRRPWMWALAVGLWIPMRAIVLSASPQSLAMLLVLVFPFAGAYTGMALRRMLVLRLVWSGESHDKITGDLHDRKGFHFLVMTKHGRIDPELAAIVDNPDENLVPFLERMAPAPLGPLGQAESVTDQSESRNARVRKYRVVFAGERKIICRIEMTGGRRVAVHWSKTDVDRIHD